MSSPWRSSPKMKSLSEVFGTIPVPVGKGFWQNLRAFMGPGFLVAVGYMDPGNWATDLAGGASFGYTLLSVILISSIFAIILQHLALKLGVASGRDLAQACGDAFSKPVAIFLWLICEVAIAACDLAEVIGSALALPRCSRQSFWSPVSWSSSRGWWRRGKIWTARPASWFPSVSWWRLCCFWLFSLILAKPCWCCLAGAWSISFRARRWSWLCRC